MTLRAIHRSCLTLLVLSLASACASSTPRADDNENLGGAGPGHADDDDEGPAPVEMSLQFGEGVGSTFVPFVQGDLLPLEFASQAGMEASISVVCQGIPPQDVQKVVVRLVVEGAPIGESSAQGESIRFDGVQGRLDTSIPIDVFTHPTVKSVAQLKGVEADLRAEFWGDTELLVEETLRLTLDP